MQNKWKKYIGIATTAITEKNQKELYVFLPELTPLASGKISEETEMIEINLENSAAPQTAIQIETSDTILATYFGIGGTNRSIPDVHIGEQLIVYNYAESDTYYWAVAGRDDNVRVTEHLRFSVADTKKTLEDLNDDNTFFIELDTKYDNKHLLVSTSNSNGETYRYFFKIDAIANTVELKDDSGNVILLDSDKVRIKATNKSGTFVDIINENMTLYAPTNIDVVAGSVINLIAPVVNT